LKGLSAQDRKTIGEDIKTVQFCWPLGMPLVDHLEGDIWEVRNKLDNRIARVLFVINNHTMILLHGFIKKSQHEENPHIGSSFDDFLSEEAILDEVTAVATKRVIAWQISEGMPALKLSKTAMAKKMHTSRASLNRLLDEEDTSLTLTTLVSAAAALGKKVKIELEPV
jgi:metal-responsive CopG/Arc/MetJ family transcriptional regulator